MSGIKAMASILILAGLAAGMAPANNLTVTNTSLMSPAAGKVAVRFDIAWDNSWRDGVNWDAAWVFVKYSIDGGTNWTHATLAASGTNPPGFTNGTGTNLDIVVPADKKGAFIQRSTNGLGTVANTGVKLWWDFAADGVSRSKSALAKVFAIEMVYVPAGPFYLGSGGVEAGHFYRPDGTAQTTTPYQVLSETNPISVGSSSGNLYYISSTYGGDQTGVLSNAYPKGYSAFYLMKTDISQRQYCDFLNTLTYNQQNARHDAGLRFNSFRNFIKKTGGSPAMFGCDANTNAGAAANANFSLMNETNDGEWVACNWLYWPDGCAYADWAALRPMTELEFEKACRGPLSPVSNEYAWGNAELDALTTSALINSNTASESPNQGNCNYNNCSPEGPFRCGSYAGAMTGRTNAGAGYYGALDLSGGLYKQTVSVGSPVGRSFTGIHGDGRLTVNGNADVEGWPGRVMDEVTGTDGVGNRGGSHYEVNTWEMVSDRSRGSYTYSDRRNYIGWRGVRTAP